VTADGLGVALVPWPVEPGDEITVEGQPWPLEVVDLVWAPPNPATNLASREDRRAKPSPLASL